MVRGRAEIPFWDSQKPALTTAETHLKGKLRQGVSLHTQLHSVTPYCTSAKMRLMDVKMPFVWPLPSLLQRKSISWAVVVILRPGHNQEWRHDKSQSLTEKATPIQHCVLANWTFLGLRQVNREAGNSKLLAQAKLCLTQLLLIPLRKSPWKCLVMLL